MVEVLIFNIGVIVWSGYMMYANLPSESRFNKWFASIFAAWFVACVSAAFWGLFLMVAFVVELLE